MYGSAVNRGTIDLEVGGNKISLLFTLAIHFQYPLPCTAIRLLSAAAIAITTDLHNASEVGERTTTLKSSQWQDRGEYWLVVSVSLWLHWNQYQSVYPSSTCGVFQSARHSIETVRCNTGDIVYVVERHIVDALVEKGNCLVAGRSYQAICTHLQEALSSPVVCCCCEDRTDDC